MATDNNQEDVPNLDFVIVSDPSHGEVSEIIQEEDESATSITNNEIVMMIAVVIITQLPSYSNIYS